MNTSSLPWLLGHGIPIIALLSSSCAGMRGVSGDVIAIDRNDVASWNPHNVWIHTGVNPDTYVPKGMKKGVPVDEAHGKWVVDPQDHSRFYLPHGGTSIYPPQVLAAEASTATNRLSKAA